MENNHAVCLWKKDMSVLEKGACVLMGKKDVICLWKMDMWSVMGKRM